jgi:hypothetical protein
MLPNIMSQKFWGNRKDSICDPTKEGVTFVNLIPNFTDRYLVVSELKHDGRYNIVGFVQIKHTTL